MFFGKHFWLSVNFTLLSQLSANGEIFKNSIKQYKEALMKAGYKHKMRYQQNIRQNTTVAKNRKRNIRWFNAPCSADFVTKVGIHFLSFLDKHFPPHNKFHKIFNRNTVNISYSCMANVRTIINSHNYKIINPKTIAKERTCNCVDKATRPLSQNYRINNSIYKAVNGTLKSKILRRLLKFSTIKNLLKIKNFYY